MRRLLAATFAISMAGVLLVGAALAWTSTLSTTRKATIGILDVKLANVVDTGNKLYPGQCCSITVATGSIVNDTPKDPGIAVHVTSARAMPTPPGPSGCLPPGPLGIGIRGSVDVPVGAIPPGGFVDWGAFLTLSTAARNECQGQSVNYVVTFDLST